jgi:hypothetical protein
MSEPSEKGRLWSSLPGIVAAIAGIITAMTGLFLAFGRADGGDETGPLANQPAQTPSPLLPEDGAATADAIAGTWTGEASGDGGSFEVRLVIARGCVLDQRCGSISVSSLPCEGDLSLYAVTARRYEFSVDNFSDASASGCTPGAGEFLAPQDDGTLLYTTGYDRTIQGVLHRT